MKRLSMVCITLIIIITVVFICSKNRIPLKKEIDVDGERITVSVYSLDPPISVHPIFKESEQINKDMDKYPWLRALLVAVNDYATYIPTNEWKEYVEAPITAETVERKLKYNARISDGVLHGTNSYWRELEGKISSVVLSEYGEKGKYLTAFIDYKNAKSGRPSGGRYDMLKLVDGRWKIPNFPSFGFKLGDCILKSNKRAHEELMSSQIRLQPEGRLRSIVDVHCN